MRIDILERQPVRVACLRYTGPFGAPIGRFWKVTVAPWLAQHELLDCPRYGLALDNPAKTPPEKCRYDACVALPAGMTLPEAIEATIPGGRYAVTPFKGTAAGIAAAWAGLVGATLRSPANQVDPARHAFEHYPRGAVFDTKTGVLACELCLPLLGAGRGS